MQSYIGAGYPVMLFNMAAHRGGGSWYEAGHPGVGADARPGAASMQLLQPAIQVVRRPTRHFIADILNLRDEDDDEDYDREDDDNEFDAAARSSRTTANSVPVKRVDGGGTVWTSLSPSPPSLSSNTDDVTTSSPGSEQRSAEDLRLTTTTCRHHSAGSDSRTSDTPPSDVDYMSDHGTLTHVFIQETIRNISNGSMFGDLD